MQTHNCGNAQNRYDFVGNISKQLVRIPQSNNIAVIVYADINGAPLGIGKTADPL